MKVSPRGIDLVKSFESLQLKAYPDPATGGKPWTIGYGHTEGVKQGDTCTEAEADAWLLEDCSVAEEAINDWVDVELTQNQYDALVSLTINIGIGNFKSSTLLKLVNLGQIGAAAKQFGRWNKAAKRVMAGLTKRRTAEASLFLEAT